MAQLICYDWWTWLNDVIRSGNYGSRFFNSCLYDSNLVVLIRLNVNQLGSIWFFATFGSWKSCKTLIAIGHHSQPTGRLPHAARQRSYACLCPPEDRPTIHPCASVFAAAHPSYFLASACLTAPPGTTHTSLPCMACYACSLYMLPSDAWWSCSHH